MKTIFILSLVVALAAAEAPLSVSNRYLPPPPPSSGFPSGAPQIVAARSFNTAGKPGTRSNGFARNGPEDPAVYAANGAARNFGPRAGYNLNAADAFGRNLEPSEPANYKFGYSVNDDLEGTAFGHQEHREDERAEGQYHVVLPDGRKQTVNYEADERGFKPKISYEDSENQDGYDNNGQRIGSRAFGHGANGGYGNHGNARNGY